MPRRISDSPSECGNVLGNEASRTRMSASVVEPVLMPLYELLNAIVERRIDSGALFALLPVQMASLLNHGAHSFGQTDFASLSKEQQGGLCSALLDLATEAPVLFAQLNQRAGNHSRGVDNDRRDVTTMKKSPLLISRQRIFSTNGIMCEVRSGNHPSAAVDDFGTSVFSEASPSFTLADMLRAAIAGKVDPATVFNALPQNLITMIDEASRHATQVDFQELPTEAQRTLFAAILEAMSGTTPTTPVAKPATVPTSNVVAPPSVDSKLARKKRPVAPTSAKSPPVKNPWWKFW